MENEQDKRQYLLIPLPLVQELFVPNHCPDFILGYGLVDAAHRLYKREEGFSKHPDFLNDLFFCFYHQPDDLPDEIKSALDSLAEDGTVTTDEYYKGFGGDGKLNPEEEVFTITEFFRQHQDNTKLEDHIWEWCTVRATLARMGFRRDSAKWEMQKYNLLNKDFTGEPLCSIGASFLFEYLQKSKSDEDFFRLAMLMGISSIIGTRRSWAATTSDMIICRMFGCKNQDTLDNFLSSNEQARKLWEKYSKRRAYEKLRKQIFGSGMVKCVLGYGRRTYVSIKCDYSEIESEIVEYISKRNGNEVKESMKNNRQRLAKLVHL